MGLCSYVYTTDLKQANKASEKLETGCVAINTPVVAAEVHLVELNKQAMKRRWLMAIKDYLNIKYITLYFTMRKNKIKKSLKKVNQ